MPICPNCRALVSLNAASCNRCGASFEGVGSWRPLEEGAASNITTERHRGWPLVPTLILLFTLAPVILAFTGFGLKVLLDCGGDPFHVTVCAQVPWAAPIITFLSIYCGWAMVFTVPTAALAALVFAVLDSR